MYFYFDGLIEGACIVMKGVCYIPNNFYFDGLIEGACIVMKGVRYIPNKCKQTANSCWELEHRKI